MLRAGFYDARTAQWRSFAGGRCLIDENDSFRSPPMAIPASPPTDRVELLRYAGYGVGQIWRDGKCVGIGAGRGMVSTRCFKCNELADDKPLKRRLSWHTPAVYLLLLLSPIIYVLVALLIRKTTIVYVGLCPRHKHRHRVVVAITALMVVSVVPLGIAGSTAAGEPVYFISAFFSLLIGLIVYATAGHVVTAKRISDRETLLRGAGAEFLKSLPPGRMVA
ncbi:MAG TPA: hypothetical protein PK093_14230 [Phycisphaerae bacterium]|nr:hypothetical protein [Phycisphaerae bacterium]